MPGNLEPQLLKPPLDLLEMKVERTQLLHLVLFEMPGGIRIRFKLGKKICIGLAGMFRLPGFHRIPLHNVISILAGKALLYQSQQYGLRIPHPE